MDESVVAGSSGSGRGRILIVSPLPPPIGGIGSWAESLLASSLSENHDLRVLDTSPPPGDPLRGGNRLRLGRVSSSLRSLVQALRLLLGFRPDLVHVNSSYYWGFLRDGAIVWLSSAFGRPVLMHLHGGDFDVFLGLCPAPVRWLVWATLQRCAGVIVLTRAMEAALTPSLGAERVHYLPNFVPAALFDAAPRTKSDFVEVLFVGWVIETKGVRELLQAARDLPGARFTLAGPIDEAFRESVAADLHELGDRVRLLGRLAHEQVRALYADVDVFVLPSHREGFPVSVLEAMAASLPVVATPVGAIPDTFRDGEEGFLVPVGDPVALAGRLRELVEDADRRRQMGAAARKRVRRDFDVESVVARLVELYRTLAPKLEA